VARRIPEDDQLFRSLTEQSLVGIYVVQDGMFQSINPNAASYYGCAPEELKGKRSNSIVHPEDKERHRQCTRDMLKGKRSSPHEFRIISRSGDIHWIMETVTPIIYEGRPAILGNSMDITERKRAEEALERREMELQAKTNELEDMNSALRVLMKQREQDKEDLENRVISNVRKIILPCIDHLKKCKMDKRSDAYLSLLESNLREIITPFSMKLSTQYQDLTKTEIRVIHFIKEGKSSKEIAQILNTSKDAIDFHRNNIRKKLSIKNTKTNLRTYLLSMK